MLTENDILEIDAILKRAHPETKHGFYGKIKLELDYKNSAVGYQPYTEVRKSHKIEPQQKRM